MADADSRSEGSGTPPPATAGGQREQQRQLVREHLAALDNLANELNLDPDEVRQVLRASAMRAADLPEEGSESTLFLFEDEEDMRQKARAPSDVLLSPVSSLTPASAPTERLRSPSPPSSSYVFQPATSSSNSYGRRSQASTRTASAKQPLVQAPVKEKKKVRFETNYVKSVTVYEVDRRLYVDIQYGRNAAGWVIALAAVVVYVAWDYYVFSLHSQVRENDRRNAGKPGAARFNWDMVFMWAAIWELLLWFPAVFLSQVLGFLAEGDLKALRNRTTAGVIFVLGLGFAFRDALNVVGNDFDEEYTPMFSPAVTMDIVFLLVMRLLLGRETFATEWILAGATVLCSFVASTAIFAPHRAAEATFDSNALKIAEAVVIAASYLLLEWTQKRSNSSLIRLSFYLVFGVLWNLLYVAARGSLDFSWSHAVSVAHGNVPWLLPSFLIGLGSFVFTGLVFRVVRYLDVLSIGACFTAKQFASPFLCHWLHSCSYVADNFWSWPLWVAAPFALLCSGGLILFASLRRQFVARELSIRGAALTPTARRSPEVNSTPAASATSSHKHYDAV